MGTTRIVEQPAVSRPVIPPLDEVPVIRIPTSAATLQGFCDWVCSKPRLPYVRFSYLRNIVAIGLEAIGLGIHLPVSAFTLDGFCRWVVSKDFPKGGRISFLNNEIVIDMSPEEIETHNKVKEVVGRAIGNLNEELDLGVFYPDGIWLTNDAGLSSEPDGTFVSWKTHEARRVQLRPRRGRAGHFTQMTGSPDWILEVVSQSTVHEDTQTLRLVYCRARIPEYWLIDARGAGVDFQILVRRRNRYVAVRPRDGWRHSPVFGRGFRLERSHDRVGDWKYKLHVSPD